MSTPTTSISHLPIHIPGYKHIQPDEIQIDEHVLEQVWAVEMVAVFLVLSPSSPRAHSSISLSHSNEELANSPLRYLFEQIVPSESYTYTIGLCVYMYIYYLQHTENSKLTLACVFSRFMPTFLHATTFIRSSLFVTSSIRSMYLSRFISSTKISSLLIDRKSVV